MDSLSFEEVLEISRSWDAVYFLAVFAAAVAYALWPRNKEKFARAAQIPLANDEDA